MEALERQLSKEGVRYYRQGNVFRLEEEGRRIVRIEVGTEDAYSGLSNEITIKGAKRGESEWYENNVNTALMSLPPLSSFAGGESFCCPSCRSPPSFEIREGTFFCKKCLETVRYGDVIRCGGTGNL